MRRLQVALLVGVDRSQKKVVRVCLSALTHAVRRVVRTAKFRMEPTSIRSLAGLPFHDRPHTHTRPHSRGAERRPDRRNSKTTVYSLLRPRYTRYDPPPTADSLRRGTTGRLLRLAAADEEPPGSAHMNGRSATAPDLRRRPAPCLYMRHPSLRAIIEPSVDNLVLSLALSATRHRQRRRRDAAAAAACCCCSCADASCARSASGEVGSAPSDTHEPGATLIVALAQFEPWRRRRGGAHELWRREAPTTPPTPSSAARDAQRRRCGCRLVCHLDGR